jgi:hypothetical protein
MLIIRLDNLLVGHCLLLAWLGGLALAESVAETAAHDLQVAHTASAGCLSPLALFGPFICKKGEKRETTISPVCLPLIW